MAERVVAAAAGILRLIPDRMPGKTRIGRILLNVLARGSEIIVKDRYESWFILPSYREPMAQHLFTFGAYEPDTRDAILKFLPDNGTFIDVGANIGALTIPVAKSRPQAAILCIEADPDIYRFLQANVNRNACRNVRVVCCVASNSDREMISFYRAPQSKFGMGSIGPQFGSAPVSLEQRSLDDLLPEMGIKRADVIKIDVEGAELSVLRGARKLLDGQHGPVVIFEFSDWAEGRIAGQHAGAAQELLLGMGYRLFQVGRRGCKAEEVLSPLQHGTAMLLALPSSRVC